jgi:hypothetical protein
MNPTPDLDQLRTLLGLTDAPVVRRNLETVAGYFVNKLHQSPFIWISYLKGIDFSKPTEIGYLNQGREVIRHVPADASHKPFVYFTEPGTSPLRTGTNFPDVRFERYAAIVPIEALFSSASWMSFGPRDRISRPGGGKQIIIATTDFVRLRKM